MKEVTNVEEIPEFKSWMTPYLFVPEGAATYKDDWVVNDFTFEEIKYKLFAKNRLESWNPHLNNMFWKVSLEEVIELQLMLNKEHPQTDGWPFPTGLYIETKNVGFYKRWGIDIAGLLYDVL